LQHEEEAPHEDVDAEAFADWEALKQEISGKDPGQESKVENR